MTWHQAALREAVDGELMHRLGDPTKGRDLPERKPLDGGDLVAGGRLFVLVNMDVVAQENGRLVFSERRAHAGETHDPALQTGFFHQFPERSLFGAFPVVNMALGKTPLGCVGTFGFLDEKNSVVVHHSCGNAQIAEKAGHEPKIHQSSI